MNRDDVVALIQQLPGWADPDKVSYLYGLPLPEGARCAEIGVYGGRSLLPIAAADPTRLVYAIDPWHIDHCNAGKVQGPGHDYYQSVDMEEIYRGFAGMVEDLRLPVVVMREPAQSALEKIPDEHLDYLHVDGNHAEEIVYSDIVSGFRKLKPGGYLVLDDTHFETLRKSLDWLLERATIIHRRDAWAAFRKEPPSPDVVVTAMLTKHKHHTKVVGQFQETGDEKLYDYLRPWYKSIHEQPGLRGVVLHDGLPESFTQKYTSAQVDFLDTGVRNGLHPFLERYYHLEMWMHQVPSTTRFLFTDINDVAFVANPFTWWDGYRLPEDVLLFGEDWERIGCNWFQDSIHVYPTVQSAFLRHICIAHPVNAGMWGGRVDVAKRLVIDRLLREFEHHNALIRKESWVSWDMVFMQYLVIGGSEMYATFKMDFRDPSRRCGTQGITLRRPVSNPLVHGNLCARDITGDRLFFDPPA